MEPIGHIHMHGESLWHQGLLRGGGRWGGLHCLWHLRFGRAFHVSALLSIGGEDHTCKYSGFPSQSGPTSYRIRLELVPDSTRS